MPSRDTYRWRNDPGGEEEIREGLLHWQQSPVSNEGANPNLVDAFDEEETPVPLRKEDVEREVEQFIHTNFALIFPVLMHRSSSNRKYGSNDQSIIIDALNLTNEDIGLLGANYSIHVDGDQKSFVEIEQTPPHQGTAFAANIEELLGCACARDMLRVDTQKRMGRVKRFPHRFFFRPAKRYLCANDFGMRYFDSENDCMTNGDVTNVDVFVKTLARKFGEIIENIETLRIGLQRKIDQNSFQQNELPEGQHQQEMTQEFPIDNALLQIMENPANRTLLLHAIPIRKAANHLHFHYERIAKKFHCTSDDPLADYQRFTAENGKAIETVFRSPYAGEYGNHERDGRYKHRMQSVLQQENAFDATEPTIPYVMHTVFQRPVIAMHFNTDMLLQQAKTGVRAYLARQAAATDAEMHKALEQYSCTRGEQSPFFFSDDILYDFLQEIGPEKASAILAQDDRQRSEQMDGFRYLQRMGFDYAHGEAADIRKQLFEAAKLERSSLWDYLLHREETATGHAVSPAKMRRLFYEGKRMYWIASQVFRHRPKAIPDDRFYHIEKQISWAQYDCSSLAIDPKTIDQHLTEHRGLITALLCEEQTTPNTQSREERMVTLSAILPVLERGRDIRGIAIATNKKRYIDGLMAREIEDDLSFALDDWPEPWKSAIQPTEIALYYENANEYVLQDAHGLERYAAWLCSEEGRQWKLLFQETPSDKSDLDFRLCIASQTTEVRDWCREAIEHVGNLQVISRYMLRFNATRGTDGRWANWHDALLWAPNIRRLQPTNARSILATITTADENNELIELLPQYDRKHDKLLSSQRPIDSLRELKKRVLAIRSNIDLSTIPSHILDITTAPGFNLLALERLMQRTDWNDLVQGKLDIEQPFTPVQRLFCGRDIPSVLQECLGSSTENKSALPRYATITRKIFHALKNVLNERNPIEGRLWTVKDLLQRVPVILEEEIITILRAYNVDIGGTIEAEIHAKSDPTGWVCGNYTDCCMPFGSANNDDYMFNPATQYFTIRYNGRPIAQSVIVDACYGSDASECILLDNIEVANNYKNFAPILSRIYKTFWSEYTATGHYRERPIFIGTGYLDLIPEGSRMENNTCKPKKNLRYSDATGRQIYRMQKIQGIESFDALTVANVTERDAEHIATLERECYPETMCSGSQDIRELLERQRELDVPGAASSFLIRKGKKSAGYMLLLPEESKVHANEKVAHIYDMTVLPEFRGTSVVYHMMERVLEAATAYGVSIEAEARASTTYALLMNARIRQWLSKRGFVLTVNEKLPASERLGGEDFYFIRLENRNSTQQQGE